MTAPYRLTFIGAVVFLLSPFTFLIVLSDAVFYTAYCIGIGLMVAGVTWVSLRKGRRTC